MKKNFVILAASLLALSACAGNDNLSSSKDSSNNYLPLSAQKIFDRLSLLNQTLNFRQVGSNGTNTIYNKRYIEHVNSQSGIVKVDGYKEKYPEVLMGFHYSVDEITGKTFSLDMMQQDSSTDFETPASDLSEYIYLSVFNDEELGITVEDITEHENGTFGITYDSSWTDATKNYLFYVLCGQFGYYTAADKGKISFLGFSFDNSDNLVVTLESVSSGVSFTFTFDQIGEAKDEELEAFLDTENGKIPSYSIPDNVIANLFTKKLSTTTTFNLKNVDGSNFSQPVTMKVSYCEDKKYFAAGNSDTPVAVETFYTKNALGNYDTLYIDGTNNVAHSPTKSSFESLGFGFNTINKEDVRAYSPSSNSYHYYGLNENKIVAALAGLDYMSYYGINCRDVEFIVTNGKVSDIHAVTYSGNFKISDGSYVPLYVDYLIHIEDSFVEIGEPAKYQANADTPDITKIVNNMKSQTKLGIHVSEYMEGDENHAKPTFETEYVYTDKIHYVKTTSWSETETSNDPTKEENFKASVNTTGFIDKGSEGVQPFVFWPNGTNEANGEVIKGKELKDVDPILFNIAPELLMRAKSAKNLLLPINEAILEVANDVLPLGAYGSLIPLSNLRIYIAKDKDGNLTNFIERIEYGCSFSAVGMSGSLTGEVTFTYGDDVVADANILAEAEKIPVFTAPTSWSTSHEGAAIQAKFNEYFKGCVDEKGNPLSVDLLPYTYIQSSDRFWEAYQYANGTLHLRLSQYDGKDRYSVMKQFKSEIESSSRFTKKVEKGTGLTYYVCGDLTVFVSGVIDQGYELTKTSEHNFE